MNLVIISGKGGTGKTTVAGAFSYLSNNSLKVDCDVDASNLHILLGGEDIEKNYFIGAKVSHIDNKKCIKCGKCEVVCRFNAIKEFKIDPLKCEGCGACSIVCKYDAVKLEDEVTGNTIITDTNKGILSRAEMIPGAEGSGKLVTQVRKNAARYKKNEGIVILDGSPGVGCAVMASVTGCDAALIVVEPTQSGIDDFLRVLEVTKIFGLNSFVCINKYDLNKKITFRIEQICAKKNVEVIGKIPFDYMVKKSINELKPIVSYENSEAGKKIKNIWEKLNIKLKEVN